MNKQATYQAIIILSVIAIILPLSFLSQDSTVSKNHQRIDWITASKSITFDLKSGQTVNGWLNYTGDTNGAWFLIGDPNGNEIGSRTSEGNQGTFVFTATVNGQYFIDIGNDNPFGDYIDYAYTISAPPILGINPIVLIGLVITVAIIMTGVNILVYNRKREK
ncbi:MAG: hypothetical protein NWE92_06045 [Candidatus Bathyarchaeota archaeon]|nr:hypothetical protein [Candidatus Bathyarchaeota archaeon]